MESKVFELASQELEKATSLSGLEARGTIRISLKSSGLSAADVSAVEMNVILRMVLPKELALRAIDDAEEIAGAIATALEAADLSEEERPDSPEAVFSRLAG